MAKIEKWTDIETYEDFKNRPDNIIKQCVPCGELRTIKEGVAGSYIVVPANIYDILKRRVAELEISLAQHEAGETKKPCEHLKHEHFVQAGKWMYRCLDCGHVQEL